MKWIKSDLQQFLTAKEYVDTVLIPLIPFHLSKDAYLEKDAFQKEILSLFSNEVEKELTGRILLTPSYNYIHSANTDREIKRLNEWITDVRKQPFHHTFLITFDSTWKKNEHAIDGTVLWFPGLYSGDLHSKEMQSIVRDQVHQVVELIRSYW